MAKFTFLEIHLDGDFVANAPFGGTMTTDEKTDAAVRASDAPSADGGRPWLAALVGLLFLLVLAALAKKKLGGEETEDPGDGVD